MAEKFVLIQVKENFLYVQEDGHTLGLVDDEMGATVFPEEVLEEVKSVLVEAGVEVADITTTEVDPSQVDFEEEGEEEPKADA